MLDAISIRFIFSKKSLLFKQWLGATFQSEIRSFALWRPVFLGIGILYYFHANMAVDPKWGVFALLPLSGVYLFAALRRDIPAIRFLIGLVLLTTFGFFLADFRSRLIAAPVLSQAIQHVEVSGRVLGVEKYENRYRMLLSGLVIGKIPLHDTPEKIRITAPAAHMVVKLKIGDEIFFKASLKPPPLPAVPGAYDFARSAWFREIGGIGYTTSKILLSHDKNQRNLLEALTIKLANLRYATTQIFLTPGNLIRDDRLPGLRAALVTAERSQINSETYSAIRGAGLAHLLAISGLHMGLIAILIFGGLRLALSLLPSIALNYNIKKYAAFFAISACLFYLFLSGATIPSQRAFLMILIAFLGIMLDRNVISLRLVSFAAFVLLLWHPEAILTASFQLSFAAVTGLVCFYESIIMKKLYVYFQQNYSKRIFGYFIFLSITTTIATLSTAPLSAYHFGEFASYGILGNLIAVPLMGMLVMPSALLAFLLLPFGWEMIGLYGMDIGLSLILDVAGWVSSLDHAVIRVPKFDGKLLAIAGLAGCWLCLWKGSFRFLALPAGALMLFAIYQPVQEELLIPAEIDLFGGKLSNSEIYITKTNRHKFIQDQWRDRWAIDHFKNFAELKNPVETLPGDVAENMCSENGCKFFIGGRLVFYIRTQTTAFTACQIPESIIVYPSGFLFCKQSNVTIIDRGDFIENGGYSIFSINHRPYIKNVMEARRNYPWQQARKLKKGP